MSNTVLTIETVKQHNTEADCYVIAHKKVYDASKVTSEKMEGFEKVLEVAGTDASSIYDSLPSNTKDSMTLLGDLSESQISGEANEEPKKTESNAEEGEEKPKEPSADKRAEEIEQEKKAQETEKVEASTPRKGKMSKKCVCM